MRILPESGEQMPVSLTERELRIPAAPGHHQLLRHVSQLLDPNLDDGKIPIRAVITASDERFYNCEVGTLAGSDRRLDSSIFEFVRRQVESTDGFNAVLLVPTGIGAEIGGHAGDATPVAALLASVCSTLITHPNVVNASDIIDIPSNTLYVEGSVISRLLMGTVGLQKVRRNRLLVVLGYHEDDLFVNAEMIRQGWAWTYEYFPFSQKWHFRTCQREARSARRGIWQNEPESLLVIVSRWLAGLFGTRDKRDAAR